MKVEVTDLKTGRRKSLSRRDADILVKLGRAEYSDRGAGQYATRHLEAGGPQSTPQPAAGDPAPQMLDPDLLISDAVREFAAENGIDPAKVSGTGKNQRINKADIEAAIRARDEEQ